MYSCEWVILYDLPANDLESQQRGCWLAATITAPPQAQRAIDNNFKKY